MCKLLRDNRGDTVVEATILFPIMTMIFAALVLLSIFMPAQAVLQRATQFTAIALATEKSDTWLIFDDSTLSFTWETDSSKLRNVYADLFSNDDIAGRGESITREVESRSISSKEGELSVRAYVESKILYKEVVVIATREYPMPVDLSFIGFPRTIEVKATSSAVAQNASEFIRSMDMASDFAVFIIDKYQLHDITDAISSFGAKVTSLLGWNS